MPPDREALERMKRDELIAAARGLGVRHPELMTRVELGDEILRQSERDRPGAQSSRGWLGVARDLVARLVERGLHLPQAAALIRTASASFGRAEVQTPVATVTLAEIYGAQGHFDRALRVLDDVLVGEPDHGPARELRDRLAQEQEKRKARRRRRAPQQQPAPEAPIPPPAVVSIADDGYAFYVYWEVDPRLRQQLAVRHPEGELVVRVVSFQPAWEGAQRSERDVVADGERAGTSVELPSPDAVSRAVLGCRTGSGFRPLAVGLALGSDGERSGGWVPPALEQADTSELSTRAVEHFRST